MSNLQQISKDIELKEYTRRYNELISDVDYGHLTSCPCHNHLVEEQFQLLWPKREAQLKAEGKFDDEYVVSSNKTGLRSRIRKELAAKFSNKNKKCPLEYATVSNTLKLFVNSHYDLNNPVVYGIVRKTLEQELISFRLNLKVKDDSLLVWKEGREGSGEWVLNPLVEANRRASESIIKAFEVLSKIVDGTLNKNVNIEIDASKVFNREEMYGDLIEIPSESHKSPQIDD
mgnify:CR=1 FL=1